MIDIVVFERDLDKGYPVTPEKLLLKFNFIKKYKLIDDSYNRSYLIIITINEKDVDKIQEVKKYITNEVGIVDL